MFHVEQSKGKTMKAIKLCAMCKADEVHPGDRLCHDCREVVDQKGDKRRWERQCKLKSVRG